MPPPPQRSLMCSRRGRAVFSTIPGLSYLLSRAGSSRVGAGIASVHTGGTVPCREGRPRGDTKELSDCPCKTLGQLKKISELQMKLQSL